MVGHLARDKVIRPRAVGPDDVPTSVAAITPMWLTAVLCAAAPGAEVREFTIIEASHGTHHRHRLALTYNEVGREAELPPTVFVKSPPTLVTRMIGGYNGTARVEGRFYTLVRPKLDLEAPVGYHSAFDPRTLACVNLIEDLVATKNATFCDHQIVVTKSRFGS